MRRMRALLPVVAGAALLVVAGAPGAAADRIPEIDGLEMDGGAALALPPAAARARALKAVHLAGAHLEAKAKKPGAAKTVSVDCTKGQSIQSALDSNAGPLVVDVHGVCLENVRVERRTGLTLRGTDPATDGIQGVAADPQPVAALEILYSDGVGVENLSISGSPQIGVGMWFSHVTMENCRMVGNARAGLHASSNSFLAALELTLSGNGGRGMQVQRSATAFCTGCVLEDNASFAAGAAFGALLTLIDSVVASQRGLVATFDSYADIDCVSGGTGRPCGLTASLRATQALAAGTVALFGAGDFSGQLVASDRGHVYVFGSRQVSPGKAGGSPLPNRFHAFSTLFAEPFVDDLGVAHESKLLGHTQVSSFSRALLLGATELDGTLACDSAGDAWGDGVILSPGSSITGCEHVPPAGP